MHKRLSITTFFLIFAVLIMSIPLHGCGSEGIYSSKTVVSSTDVGNGRIGVIYVGDELEGWTAAQMIGVREAIASLNIPDDQVIEEFSVPEDGSAYDACVSLINQGCGLIFATSFSFEDYIIKAAEKYPDVEFCHCSGVKANEVNLPNYHNYYDRIFEARYVSGVAAGMKLKDMQEKNEIIKPKIGYVGAYPYAEVISGYTAFFLGVRSIVPDATMEVRYTNAWTDLQADYETAQELVRDGCILLSQHSDTAGVAYVCQDRGIPFVGFNIDMTSVAPDTAITSPTNHWSKYYEYAIENFEAGQAISTDWSGGYSEGVVDTTPLGSAAVPGTFEAMEKAKEDIISGSLYVFDGKNFTINGVHPDETFRDDNGKLVFSDGYFHESEERSAPSFDMIIDGITEVRKKK